MAKAALEHATEHQTPQQGFKRVLVADDEESIRHVLGTVLRAEGLEVSLASSGQEALKLLSEQPQDVLLSDIRMPKMSGLDLLGTVQEKHPGTVVIMMSAYGNVDTAIEAIKLGAYDYIAKPFKPVEAVLVIRKAEEREKLKRENVNLKRTLARTREDSSAFSEIIARSDAMHDIFKTVRKIAEYKTTVLIQGESGTGKELVARAVHRHSPRAVKQFVAVNCGAIPENLLESELFGHRKGAFTDATRDKVGLFAEADGGTLFLDEIGELPLSLQVKLLRVLQEEEVRRVGDSKPTSVDVRIIAATVRDLSEEAKASRFREDLFYRLNVLPITVPALRDRREDVAVLVDHFIERNNHRLGLDISGVSSAAFKVLLEYQWPGNVRELENTIEHAMVLSESSELDVSSLPAKVRESQDPIRQALTSGDLSIKRTARMIEEVLIRRALEKTSGNRTAASKLLEISHRALLYKIKEYGIIDD